MVMTKLQRKPTPRYAATGRINDGIEQGKAVLVIGDSVSEMRKYAEKHGVYELGAADEITGSMVITYCGMGTGLRIWPNFEEGESVS
jgi:hypothetical protein